MDADEFAESLSPTQRYLILAAVVLGSSLYSTALLTTSTILPQMQGAMSATQDEIAWIMTFNILATAVVTPMTGWLVARFGTKRVMTLGILTFSIATLMCGLAQSLDVLVVWRIVQGATGAPVVPLSQTILMNTFPRRQHPMVLSVFGMAVGVAPVVGPVLGGYLAEAYTWRWAFHMLVPVGLLAAAALYLALPPDTRSSKAQLDWTGFLALATAMAAVQLILARGVRLDWFESTEIIFLMAGVTSRLDPRIGMSIGFLIQVASGIWMLSFDLNITMEILILNSLVQGFSVGMIWVPLSVVAFDTLAPSDRAEAASVFHLLRNIGSSFFISLSIAEIVRATGANYSRMTEMISPYNTTLSLPWVTGAWDFGSVAGLAKVAKEINRQAAMIGYLNAFVMYAMASGLGLFLVLIVRRRKSTLARA